METEADALDLARSIINTAAETGLPARAVVTDMSEVLGRNAGNALEVRETIDFLTGAWATIDCMKSFSPWLPRCWRWRG